MLASGCNTANKQEETPKLLKEKLSEMKLLIANCLIKNSEKCPTEQEFLVPLVSTWFSGTSFPYILKRRTCIKVIKKASPLALPVVDPLLVTSQMGALEIGFTAPTGANCQVRQKQE